MRVPLLDLQAQYRSIREEVREAVGRVLDSQRFILGPEVEALEAEVCARLGAKHAVGVCSGSDALVLSLMALGVGPGDVVLTTPFTFFATAGAISLVGARPAFVDIDPATFNLDPDRLAEALERLRPRAVIPVHLFGQCAEMDPILEACRGRGVRVVEDAAQAFGARYRGRAAGTMGDVGCFSFFPSKVLGGYGDGGMVVTDDPDLAAELRLLRVHGSPQRYVHVRVGRNARLDEIQAAVLRVKLRHLEGWLAARRQVAQRYRQLFREAGLEEVGLPAELPHAEHVYHQFVIRVPRRDQLREHLRSRGVDTQVYYPLPLHLQPCYVGLGYRAGDFPEAERAAREVLALPIYPELSPPMQEHVVKAIAEFYGRRGP